MFRSPCAVLPRLAGILAVLAVAAPAQRPEFHPQTDYAYNLAATGSTVVELELTEDGFVWPQGTAGADTALLEITLKATKGPAPEIQATRGPVTVRQVFEELGRGRRFLDLSALLTVKGPRVALTGQGAAWQEGTARLFLYRNARLAGRRVLVLAPHPDDAEIAAFGLYRTTQADVVTVTAGDAGGDDYRALFPETAEQYRVKGWLRTWDSITVPFYGGVMPGAARNLGYYDATLPRLQADPAAAVPPRWAALERPDYFRRLNVDPELRDRPFTGTWAGLVTDLVRELERVRPTIIVAPHPLLDHHADHQFTTIALIEALARWPGECELYLYTNHNLEAEAFPLGDREARTGLPAWSGGDLFFSRIYSHPLTPEEQQLKRLALEGMHDLRTFDLRDGRPVRSAEDEAKLRKNDYYRRAPRPNELFFVVTREDAVRLREAFLGRQ